MAGKKVMTDWELACKRLEQIKLMRIEAAEKARIHFNEQLDLLEHTLLNYEKIREEIFANIMDNK